MSRWKTLGLATAIVILFLLANRGAYKGYFQDDDLDNLSWNPHLDKIDYLTGLVSPVFSRNNFRPVGHFYFYAMERLAGLRFVPYIAVLQFFHLCNGLLIWLVLRRLKIHPLAAMAGAVFFLYHPATFDAYWQPMYVFDVLCGTFCLVAFLAFIDRRWILSFVCFVCAYKAKEVAVMLPAILATYEVLLGERRWKPLIPFFAVSLLFGVQALISNANTNDAYTLKVTAATLLASLLFYLPRIFAFSLGLFVMLAAASVFRDRRAWLGLCATLLFLIPLLAIPSRTFSVYLYVPLIGATVALASALDRIEDHRLKARLKTGLRPAPEQRDEASRADQGSAPPRLGGFQAGSGTNAWAALVFLAVWLPFTFLQMREYRRAALTAADENRSYVSGLTDFLRASPQTTAFIEDGAPAALHWWGVRGAIRYISKKPDIQLAAIDEPEAIAVLAQPHLAVLSWDQVTRKLQITQRDPDTTEDSYISMRRGMPIWQFGDGWYQREGFYRWTKPEAKATLRRPESASKFEVTVNVGTIHIHDLPKVRLEVLLDGVSLGVQDFTTSGWQKRIYPLKLAPAGRVTVEFRTSPAYHPQGDPRVLGIPIGGFGFVEGL